MSDSRYLNINVEEDGQIKFSTTLSIPEMNLLLDQAKLLIITGELNATES